MKEATKIKRCVVKFSNGSFCNIEADMIVREEGIIFAFNKTSLAGAFDLGFIDAIYLNEKTDRGNQNET